MKPRRKKYRKSHFQSDPKLLKKAYSKQNLTRGLWVLASLWKRCLLPRDLENHYLMTWLAYANGNVSRLSEVIGWHRNTLVLYFRDKIKKPSTIKFRKLWLSIRSKDSKKAFPEKVLEFYQRMFSKPRFSKRENAGLVHLWLMGVPRKVVKYNFILYLFRQGKNINEVSQRLGMDARSISRYRWEATKPGSPAIKWFKPLKAKREEWYPSGHRRGRKRKLNKTFR